MAVGSLIALALASALVPASGPPAVELTWHQLGAIAGQGELRVSGLAPEAVAALAGRDLGGEAGESLLRVVVAPSTWVDEAALRALPNVWGKWSVADGELAFRPRHVVAPGAILQARFDGRAFDRSTGSVGTPQRTLRVVIPPGDGVTEVLGVSPGGAEVPENLLRIYLEFSRPMSLRDVERHVRLLDSRGSEIPHTFVEVPGGLWDPSRRRLTMIVHPGRVKRGLAMGERLGPLPSRGETITLAVDAAALDADGRPLARAFEHTWRVGPPRRERVDPRRWRLISPATPRAPLLVEVPWALDTAIAVRALSVVDPDGEPVAGRFVPSAGDRSFEFHPDTAWRAGHTYRLRVEDFLEDPSGNRPGRAFETEVGEAAVPGPHLVEFVPRFPASG